MRDPVVASFWTGSKLTFLEQLCLKSFADQGHRTVLYSYDLNLNVPDGVDLHDANEIVPMSRVVEHRQGFAPFSDMFRLNMIAQTGAVWIDCDVVALQPMPDLPYIFARAGRPIANGVLRLPRTSRALAQLLHLVNGDEITLPADWPWRKMLPEAIRARQGPKDPIRLTAEDRGNLHYQTMGPHALTYFLSATGEDQYALPPAMFYPVHPTEIRLNCFRPGVAPLKLPDGTVALHGVGGTPFRKKFATMAEFVPPNSNSLIGQLCARHGIDPMSAPPQISDRPAPEAQTAA